MCLPDIVIRHNVTQVSLLDTKLQKVALVKVPHNECFSPLISTKSEDTLVVLTGKGRVEIAGESREVTPLTLIHAAGKVHQIFNDQLQTLSLLWIQAPGALDEQKGLYIRTKEECYEYIPEDNKTEKIYEWFGVANGGAKHHSVALVEMAVEGSSDAHYHPVVEESYVITEGIATVIIGDERSEVKAGDAVVIPVGKVHQIVNIGQQALKFIAIVTPPWTPDCGVYVKKT